MVTRNRISVSNMKKSLLHWSKKRKHLYSFAFVDITIVWLQVLAVNILGRFLLNNDKNIRYEVSLNFLYLTNLSQQLGFVACVCSPLLLYNLSDFTSTLSKHIILSLGTSNMYFYEKIEDSFCKINHLETWNIHYILNTSFPIF